MRETAMSRLDAVPGEVSAKGYHDVPSASTPYRCVQNFPPAIR